MAHQVWAGTFAATFALVALVQCSTNDSDTGSGTATAAASSRPALGPTGTVVAVASPANVRLADGRAVHIPMLNMILGSHGLNETCERASDQRLAETMLRGQPVRLAAPPRTPDTVSLVPAGHLEADVTVRGVDYASAFESRAYAQRLTACPPPAATYSDPAPSSSGNTDVDVDHDDTNHRDGAFTGGFCSRRRWC